MCERGLGAVLGRSVFAAGISFSPSESESITTAFSSLVGGLVSLCSLRGVSRTCSLMRSKFTCLSTRGSSKVDASVSGSSKGEAASRTLDGDGPGGSA